MFFIKIISYLYSEALPNAIGAFILIPVLTLLGDPGGPGPSEVEVGLVACPDVVHPPCSPALPPSEVEGRVVDIPLSLGALIFAGLPYEAPSQPSKLPDLQVELSP